MRKQKTRILGMASGLLLTVMTAFLLNFIPVYAQETDTDTLSEGIQRLSDELNKSIGIKTVAPAVPDQQELSEVFYNDRISTYADGNNDANHALFLDTDYIGVNLTDSANNLENWYYIQSQTISKISILLQQPENGDYDIYLYHLNDTTLELVSYSIYAGQTTDVLSYVAQPGYYFIRVVPVVTANPVSTYLFRVDMITEYDGGEPDDNIWTAKNYTNSINVNRTIDNTFDVDTYKLTVNAERKYYLSLSVPGGTSYDFLLYDKDLKPVGSFTADGKPRTAKLAQGEYYVQVMSHDGSFSTSLSYNLKLQPMYASIAGGTQYFSKEGRTVELTSNAIYIDGTKINLDWDARFDGPQYTRAQKIITNSNTTIHPSIAFGSFTGKEVSAADAVQVKIDNFLYSYYLSGQSSFSHRFNSGEYISIFIDAASKKVIDTEVNWYYTSGTFSYRFQ